MTNLPNTQANNVEIKITTHFYCLKCFKTHKTNFKCDIIESDVVSKNKIKIKL